MLWIIAILLAVLLFLTMLLTVKSARDGNGGATIFCGGAFIVLFVTALIIAHIEGVRYFEITGGGANYEVMAEAPVPDRGTIVYAVDLNGNERKTDFLVEYPINGYKIEKIGKRTFLIPESTRVAISAGSSKETIFFISEDGETVNVPIALKAEGPINPPLGGTGND